MIRIGYAAARNIPCLNLGYLTSVVGSGLVFVTLLPPGEAWLSSNTNSGKRDFKESSSSHEASAGERAGQWIKNSRFPFFK